MLQKGGDFAQIQKHRDCAIVPNHCSNLKGWSLAKLGSFSALLFDVLIYWRRRRRKFYDTFPNTEWDSFGISSFYGYGLTRHLTTCP